MNITRKQLEEIGFIVPEIVGYETKGYKYVGDTKNTIHKETGYGMQNGDHYRVDDDFDVYEYGDFCPATDYTILTIYKNTGHIHIYSNCQYVGDPAMMSTLFSGKVANIDDLVKLLQQTGVKT